LKALREVSELERRFNSKIVSTDRVAGLVLQSSNQIFATQNKSLNSGPGNNYLMEWLKNVASIVKSLKDTFSCNDSCTEPRKLACNAVKKLHDLVTNAPLEGIDFEFLFQLMKAALGGVLAEVFELVVSCGLTLRFVDRERGLIGNRPTWLLIVAPPSSFKTTILSLLKDSPTYFTLMM
jgi:hypothetical protein